MFPYPAVIILVTPSSPTSTAEKCFNALKYGGRRKALLMIYGRHNLMKDQLTDEAHKPFRELDADLQRQLTLAFDPMSGEFTLKQYSTARRAVEA